MRKQLLLVVIALLVGLGLVAQIIRIYDKAIDTVAWYPYIVKVDDSKDAITRTIASLPKGTKVEALAQITSSTFWVLDTDNTVRIVSFQRDTATSVYKEVHYATPYTVSIETGGNAETKIVHVNTDSYDGEADQAWHFNYDGRLMAFTYWGASGLDLWPKNNIDGKPIQIQLDYDGCQFGQIEEGEPGGWDDPGTVIGINVTVFTKPTEMKSAPLKQRREVPCDFSAAAIGGDFPLIKIGKPYLHGGHFLSFDLPWGTPVTLDLESPTSSIHSADFVKEYPFR